MVMPSKDLIFFYKNSTDFSPFSLVVVCKQDNLNNFNENIDVLSYALNRTFKRIKLYNYKKMFSRKDKHQILETSKIS